MVCRIIFNLILMPFTFIITFTERKIKYMVINKNT